MKAVASTGLTLSLQLLLMLAAIGQPLCVHSSLVEDGPKTVSGIKSSLIHRDDYFDSGGLTHGQKRDRDLRRNDLRVQALYSRRVLLVAAALSGNPSPGSQDWQSPLSDAEPGSYLMQISLGTPVKTFVAIADTGSDLTWLQCTTEKIECQFCKGFAITSDCGTCQGDIFDVTKSSTYSSLPCSSPACKFLNQSGSECPYSPGDQSTACNYGYGYGDGTQTVGTIGQDTISLTAVNGSTTVDVTNFQFGCSNSVVSNTSLLQQNDGLVGLGRGNISFPSQLGPYFGNQFGYCLVDRMSSNKHSPLYFGKDATPNNTQIQYTPMLTSEEKTFYYVNCTGISLNGDNIPTIPVSAFDITSNGTSGGLFFDSGTTYTTLSDTILTPLLTALSEKITKYGQRLTASAIQQLDMSPFQLCFSAKWSDWINDQGGDVPTIGFQFANTSGFNLTSDTAWIPDSSENIAVCLAILSTPQDINIFGSTQQVNYQIVYDLGKDQIGFVQATCQDVSNSHKPVATVFTCLVTCLLTLLLLITLNQ